MPDLANRLSDYIDALNAEHGPQEHQCSNDNQEIDELLAAVRMVRSLKDPEMPDPLYPQRLAKAVAGEMQKKHFNSSQKTDNGGITSNNKNLDKNSGRFHRRTYVMPAAALIAGLLLFAVLISWNGFFNNNDIVYAMDRAVAQLSNYHGVIEMRSTNASGEEWLMRRAEIWSDGDKYAVRQEDGTLTVNNGEQKWQVRPQSKEVALLPLLPDPTRSGFDLRDEAERAKQYPHAVVGSEMVSDRRTTKLKISPPGGLPYYLWLDTETNLPLQVQTAMQNALQTTYTFVGFEPNTKINSQIFAYQPPAGYQVIEKDPGQLAATLEEAAAISKLKPLFPQETPARIFAFKNRMVLDYGDTTIVETAAKGSFEPAANSALGSAAGSPLEVWQKRLRWRQEGIEIQVEGSRRVELAREIANDLTLPDAGNDLVNSAQVKIPVDMEIIETSQRQVDKGSSPWQLDPLQVALTFVNLKIMPEGIVGEPEIAMPSFKLSVNNGVQAVVEVNNGPVKKVYLERLVRQDETGIWSVVGYDPS